MNRLKLMKMATMGVMAVIVARLFVIQIVQHDEWTEKAAAQQTLMNVLKAERGEIYMMDGDEPVAVVMNATVYTVIVDPFLANAEEVPEKLEPLIGDKRTAEWKDVFVDKTRRYYIVAKKVGRKAAEAIAAAELPGVWLQANTERVYPETTLGSTVLGFVNADGIGQYGVEGSMNDVLSGTDGLLKTVKDVNNVALSIGDDNVKVPAIDGESVVLTIDRNIQYRAEKIAEEQAQKLGFKNVSALVMNPQNGEILAMVNYPGYDPADYGNVESAEDYINHIVEDPYEPASVCKTFTFAAGIDLGVFSPASTYYNSGETAVDGWPIRNALQEAGLVGTLTVQQAFNNSLNTGSTQALRWLGGSETEINKQARERLYDYYYNHFGLGQLTGVELIEANGTLMRPDAEEYGINATYANMTFGQNMQVTMLQTAAGIAGIVNDGRYYAPTVVKGLLKDGELVTGRFVDGEFVAGAVTEPVRQVVSSATSTTMRQMLYETRKGWRANGTDAAGYYVGGKTGTAQVIKNGAYSMDETVATYVGVGGSEGELPSYLIMTRVWEDGKKAEGNVQAITVFNALKNYVQDALRVKPVV